MNFVNFTSIIIKFIADHQELIIGVVSAIIGAIIGTTLTLITTIVWDNHKNKKRFKALLKTLLFELKENQKRVNSVIEKLPKNIQEKIKKEILNSGVFIPEAEIAKLGWSFPKPYAVDAWKTFVSSGFAVNLPAELFQKIYKIYDSIHSINFLSSLSVNIFQILAQQNRLDEQTNKNFDQFCKFGTRSLEILLSRDIKQVSGDLERIIQ